MTQQKSWVRRHKVATALMVVAGIGVVGSVGDDTEPATDTKAGANDVSVTTVSPTPDPAAAEAEKAEAAAEAAEAERLAQDEAAAAAARAAEKKAAEEKAARQAERRAARLAAEQAAAVEAAEEAARQQAAAPRGFADLGSSSAATDPQFRTCGDANDAGYGDYVSGRDPEYDWYDDRDGDGVVCEQ